MLYRGESTVEAAFLAGCRDYLGSYHVSRSSTSQATGILDFSNADALPYSVLPKLIACIQEGIMEGLPKQDSDIRWIPKVVHDSGHLMPWNLGR